METCNQGWINYDDSEECSISSNGRRRISYNKTSRNALGTQD